MRHLFLNLSLILCAAVQAPAAAVYSFTRIAELSSSDPRKNYPAINDAGEVAFHGWLPPLSIGVWKGSGGALTPIMMNPAGPGVREVTINNSGEVAFPSSLTFGGPVHAMKGSGGPLTIISPIPASPRSMDVMPGIADNGNVTYFTANSTLAGVYTGNGGPVTPVYETTTNPTGYNDGEFLAVSDNGNIAYERRPALGIMQLHTVVGGTDAQVASYNVSVGQSLHTFDINDSGTVIVNASSSFSNGGIYVGNALGLVEIIDVGNFAAFTGVNHVAINNSAVYAFEGGNSSDSGIYVGVGSVVEQIIGIGDPLDGSTVKSLLFNNDGLNNNGDVAFMAELANGKYGAYRATLVPEPASLTVVLLGIASTLRRARGQTNGH